MNVPLNSMITVMHLAVIMLFLNELVKELPNSHSQPIVTDVGYRNSWFTHRHPNWLNSNSNNNPAEGAVVTSATSILGRINGTQKSSATQRQRAKPNTSAVIISPLQAHCPVIYTCTRQKRP